MKKYLLSTLFFLFIISANAQVLHRTIGWIEQDDMFAGTAGLSFTDAAINDDGLPVYIETVPLERAGQKIELANVRFENFLGKKSVNSDLLPAELQYKISYLNSDGKMVAWIEMVPLIYSEGVIQKLASFDIQFFDLKSASLLKAKTWKSGSVLASGKWVKIRTQKPGIYKIPYSQLQSWGFSDPSKVTLYGNGGYMLPKMNDDEYPDDLLQNSTWAGKDKDNNDCLFFYSTGTVKWEYNQGDGLFHHRQNDYSDYACYYLGDQGQIQSVQSLPDETSAVTDEVNTFSNYLLHEDELENLIKSGRRWFGDKFASGQTKKYSFSFENLNQNYPLSIYVAGAGKSSAISKFSVAWNNSVKGDLSFQPVDTGDALALYAYPANSVFNINNPVAGSEVKITYSASNGSSYGWLDYIEMNATSDLVVGESGLVFRDKESFGVGKVARFNLSSAGSNLQVWDVTDYTKPVVIPAIQNGSNIQFIVKTETLREFVAFYPGGEFPVPEKVSDIENQDLHQATVPEFIIISHPNFLSSANELADYHREHDQMTVSVVTPAQIYNEFSSGMPDVSGIRNYLRMCYNKTNAGGGALKYVLLFGDGSYDNKNVLGDGVNFIPTYQSENSLLPTSSFVTDDFYALLDPGEGEYQGLIDLGIGRIPVKTTTEAQTVVQKIKNYSSTSSLGDWRNVISFIGDDEDTNAHMQQAESLADDVNEMSPAYFTDKIYFDAFQEQSTPGGDSYPDVNAAINKRVKNGALILNYTGHANELALAHEKVLSVTDIDNWSNYNKLPIFVTATCEFSRFDDAENSGGEHILFNPNGGGIGLFSTTRVVYSSPNFVLNSELYKHIFSQDENGENLRMGEVLKRTKNGINTGINKRNFTLLADPAISLSFPKYQVVTETINGKPVGQVTETIGALSTVTVTGKITDHQGVLLSDFDGEIIPIVYDKQDTVETLGNGGENPFTYKVQNNIVYKGIATVTAGEFEFTFIVPKDISYAVASGKIIYYANNGEVDANGYTTDFKIGGFSGNNINDAVGPDITLYLNDPGFHSGDEVGKNSILHAIINDNTGINTVGTGIGHDITAVIDGDYSNVIVLNDYYLSDRDSYTSGSVIFPLSGLSVGEHTLKIKVWDVLNNSSEKEISFRISDKLEIESIWCYPNPVTDHTNFKFSHNRPDETFQTRVEIFDTTGSLIDVISQRLGSAGNESLPILWQVSQSQVLVRSGVYLYRVIIDSDDGASTSKTGRMIISRY